MSWPSLSRSIQRAPNIWELLLGSGTGRHQILHVLLKRKDIPDLLALIQNADKQAFVSIMDTRKILGGYFRKIKAK